MLSTISYNSHYIYIYILGLQILETTCTIFKSENLQIGCKQDEIKDEILPILILLYNILVIISLHYGKRNTITFVLAEDF